MLNQRSKSTPYFMSPCSLMSEFKDIHKMDQYTLLRIQYMRGQICKFLHQCCQSAHGKISTSTDHTGHSLIAMIMKQLLNQRGDWIQVIMISELHNKQHVDKYYNSPQLSVMSGYIASCIVSHRVPSCTSELMSSSEGKSRDL